MMASGLLSHIVLSHVVHSADMKGTVTHVSAQEANTLLNKRSTLQVLDVRTAKEFNKSHIQGAVNVDYYADDFAEQLKALDPDVEYLVHCRSGVRSTKSLAVLKSMGVKKLFHLDGGMKAWLADNLPVQYGN